MKNLIILSIGIITLFLPKCSSPEEDRYVEVSSSLDSMPTVFPENHKDLIFGRVTQEAAMKFAVHQLPGNIDDWETYRVGLREKVIRKTGFEIDRGLALNMKESGSTQMDGYTVKNIIFQTQPDVYATANLFVPEGEAPFPGVMVLAGHYINGRLGGVQALGHALALNGYVAMTIDPWGAGERTTEYGTYEYHGANLGASLMNIGKSLMGLQIIDNVRGVDLLGSLPYVDPEKIGATGASGGGNQTMWLAVMDERVKAAVPVVSVGTFESYVMGHNCICETFIDGLTFTEESGIIGLIAPRALLISNGLKDSNTAFYPSEMLRSYNNAKPIFELYNAGDKISHLIFDGPHSYPPETREAMLDLFNLHLKGIDTSTSKNEIFRGDLLPEKKLMNFPPGQRGKSVISTAEYCKIKGNELRTVFLETKSFDIEQKKNELSDILRVKEKSDIKKVHPYPGINGWDRFALETTDGKLIPVLHTTPQRPSEGYVIMCHPDGGKSIPLSHINELHKKGQGIVIVDLSGTGEASSFRSAEYDELAKLHTLGRSELWLGKTILGEWVKELNIVTQFLHTHFQARKIEIEGTRESGLAGLFLSVLEGNVENIILRNSPVSYLFDNRDSVDFFSMGIHLPGFLQWGDISLATALSGKDVTFINPVTMSGQEISDDKLNEYKTEFEKLRNICNQSGNTFFNEIRNAN